MYLEKSSLSIRLTEPVVPIHSTSRRASRHHGTGSEVSPPAIVRGLLTLTFAKPIKVSSIDLELQAKATTHYAQGAGPGRVDVTEEYKVHSTSTVIFKAGLVHQVRQRATSTRPRVQFREVHTASDAQYGTRPVSRSASLDPRSPAVRRRLSSEDLENDDGRNSQDGHTSVDPAPPYCRSAGQHSPSSADSYPPTTSRSESVASSSRITEPQNSPIPSLSNLTPDIHCGSPTTSVHSIRDLALSRTSSIEEAPEDDEIIDASVPHPGNVAYYGLSRIAIGSSGCSSERGRSGRSHSRFSLGKVVHIFDVVKDHVRSRSPRTGSRPRPDEQAFERGRSLTKGKARAQVSTHGVGLAQPQIGAAETSVAGGANDRSGDDWVVFSEGTYIYPIFFMIPNNSPPTMKTDHGSLIWKVKAEVRRPGAFKAKMTAQKEVIVVSLPNADNLEEVEELDLQRQWDGQFKYRVQIAGRAFPVGGKVPLQLTIMPLAKIKVHSICVYLDERTEYYTRAETQARSDAIRRATLLVIKHNNSDARYSEPILPLVSDEPHAFRKSPLHRFLRPGEDESEVASSFMGPGPWTIRHQLRVPDSCSILHPSNRTKGSNVMVNHTLKIILRVEKEETTVIAGRKKLYDIVIHTPIRILSCRCTPEWMSLPRYDEALRSEGDPSEDTSTCPCRTRHQAKARAHSHATAVPLHRATSLPTTNSNTSGDLGIFSSDSPASRTHLHELLMSGLVSERGEAPPSYERFGVVCV
ncbi:hypothetical protein J3R82DRAFT_1435 [Butyriboletus roseoflavus]|nr:hypothetical protein J3R82DRAFT_1435 [Butyriboletus roseoflavus]